MTNASIEASKTVMGSSGGRRWALLLKLVVALGVLGYLAWRLDLRLLGDRLLAVDKVMFVGAFAAIAGPIVLTSLRWQLILHAQGIHLPLRSAMSFDLIALFFNSFMPGATGGDAARVYYAIQRFPHEATRIVASILFDRGLGLMVLLCFGYAAFVAQPQLLGANEYLRTLAVYLPPLAGIAVAFVLGLLLFPSQALPEKLRHVLYRLSQQGIVGKLLVFLREQRRRPKTLFQALAITVVSYLFNFLSAFLLARGIGVPVSYTEIILLIAVLYTAISIPISLAGHGIRELVLIGLFAGLGYATAGPEAAVAFSLLLFAVQLLWSLVGGAYFLIYRSQRGRVSVSGLG